MADVSNPKGINMFTNRLRFLTAGESHGPVLIAVLEGIPAGLHLESGMLDHDLQRRQRGYGAGPRMKIERDHAEIVSGIMDGHTIGAPIALRIENINHAKWRGRTIEPFTTPRPGHADLTGAVKYGYHDLRLSLERASARETAARVAVGAVCKHLLAQFGIRVFGYVTAIGEISAELVGIPLPEREQLAEASDVRCPDPDAGKRMRDRIRRVMDQRDTLGGLIDIIVQGVPPGLGSHVHWDRKLEARLGAAVLSVQAIKGVAFGPAFENTRLLGTQVHDAVKLGEKSGQLVRPSNRAGGLEGGITTGQPLLIQAAMKPIATTLTPQETVDLATGESTPTQYERSDFCPVPRAVPILEAVVAFILADALLEKLGGDSLAEMLPRYQRLRQANLEDLPMKNIHQVFWPD
jgi:chorismate synthase